MLVPVSICIPAHGYHILPCTRTYIKFNIRSACTEMMKIQNYQYTQRNINLVYKPNNCIDQASIKEPSRCLLILSLWK